MTDLQISLMLIGGLIIVGVIIYNKWQEYRTRKTIERAFPGRYNDVLMHKNEPANNDEHKEPQLYQASEQPSTPCAPSTSKAQAEPSMAVPAGAPVDHLIDCTVSIVPESPIRGEKLMPMARHLFHIGDKPIHFIGHAVNGQWGSMSRGGIYTALLVSVQLANRHAALNELEYAEFIQGLRELADPIHAELKIPDMTEVISKARQLHQFIIDHDVQLGINIRSNSGPWHVRTLLGALIRQGFEHQTDNHLMMPDGKGEALFSILTNVTPSVSDITDRLTLLLDVPRIAPEHNAYGAMIACARSLAMRLGGVLVDDSDQLLSDAALRDIAEQVETFYSAMQSAEIPAGSSRAARLFS